MAASACWISAGSYCFCSFGLLSVRAEPVEAGACWFGRHAWVEGGGRESPGVRVTFFRVAERKSPKKGRPPVCDPFAALRGKPASVRLRGAPQNSLRACGAPFGQPRRARARSMRAPTRMLTPQPPRRRRSQQGWGSRTSEQPNCPSGHRCARPCRRSAWRLRPRDGAERSDGPNGCPIPVGSLLYAPGARRARGGHGRRSAHAS